MGTKFSVTIFLLIPYVTVLLVPYLKLRIRFGWTLPFVLLWILIMIVNRVHRVASSIVVRFASFATLFSLFILVGLAMFVGVTNPEDPYPLLVSNVLTIVPIFIFYYLIRDGRYKEISFLLIWSLVCVIIGVVSLTHIDIADARTLASQAVDADKAAERIDLMAKGVGGYGLIYSMGLLFIGSLSIIFMKSAGVVQRILLIVLSIFCLIGVVRGGYSIASIMTLLGIAFAILSRMIVRSKALSRTLMVSCVFFITVMAHPQILSPLGDPLRAIANAIDVREYRVRLESIANTLQGDKDSYAYQRSELYWLSFDKFKENPLIGIYGDKLVNGGRQYEEQFSIGGHSFVFDTLGRYGLLGMIILLLSLFSYKVYLVDVLAMRFNQEGLTNQSLKPWLCVSYALLFVAFINPVLDQTISYTYFVLIPSLIVVSLGRSERFFRRFPYERY